MFSLRRTGIIWSTLVIGVSLACPAMATWMAQGDRDVIFKAVGPGGLGIEGKGSDISVLEQGNNLAISVGLATLKTGIDLRDRHMKEKYLETSKFPRATFTVDKSQLKLPGEADAEGKLTLHGVTHPAKVHYAAKGTNKQLTITGSLRLNMKDYGIDVPSYLGVTVKPDVTVSVRFAANNA